MRHARIGLQSPKRDVTTNDVDRSRTRCAAVDRAAVAYKLRSFRKLHRTADVMDCRGGNRSADDAQRRAGLHDDTGGRTECAETGEGAGKSLAGTGRCKARPHVNVRPRRAAVVAALQPPRGGIALVVVVCRVPGVACYRPQGWAVDAQPDPVMVRFGMARQKTPIKPFCRKIAIHKVCRTLCSWIYIVGDSALRIVSEA